MAKKDKQNFTLSEVVDQKLSDHINQQQKDFEDLREHELRPLCKKLDKILTNDLPHLKEDIHRLDKKLYAIGVLASVFAPILYFIINKFLG